MRASALAVDDGGTVKRRQVVITGLGLVSPLGIGQARTWQRLLLGETAPRWLDETTPAVVQDAPQPGAATHRSYAACVPLSESATSTLPIQAELSGTRDENPAPRFETRTQQFALLAAHEAVLQAGLNREQLRLAGCVIGSSKTDLNGLDQWFQQLNGRHQAVTAAAWLGGSPLFPSAPLTAMQVAFNCQGPTLAPVAACATGLVSVIRGADLIQHGTADVVLAGGTDSSIHPGLLASYRRLGVQAPPGTDPSTACRPFDQRRNGFVVGEGAAVLVLEARESALQRGATPLAEWVGGRYGCDPTGITGIDPSGAPLAELIARLLARHPNAATAIDALCYHGTATSLNDLAEARAMRQVFPAPPPGFGVKGAIGHLMGAAGAVELALSVLAIVHQTLPPTANCTQPDPACDIPLTTNGPCSLPIRSLLKTSLGFGGHLAAGLIKRP